MENKIFAYCERGMDPSFWGEPLNAVTNAAFIVAGFLCLRDIAGRPGPERDYLAVFLSVLILAIGVGSFLFHTYAEPWAGAADVIPIAIFMLTAVYAVVKRLFDAPVWGGFIAVAGFIGLLVFAFQFRCSIHGVHFGGPIGGPCLHGSVGYAPALLALLVAGAGLRLLSRGGSGYLLAAGAVFAVSLTARSLDRELCDILRIGDAPIGSHFLWHVLNGVTLYCATMAIIRHGPSPRIRALRARSA